MLFATIDSARRTKQNFPNPPTGANACPRSPPMDPFLYASAQSGLLTVAVIQAAPEVSLSSQLENYLAIQ
jgi:hypothetical protein